MELQTLQACGCPLRFLALDFETGDLRDRAPVTLGLALFDDGELIKSKEWLFRPLRDHRGGLLWNYSENAALIHGKSLVEMEECGTHEQTIYEEVREFIGGKWEGAIVSHNASFDGDVWSNFLFVLGKYDSRAQQSTPAKELLAGPWYCTRRIAQSLGLVPQVLKNLKLTTLANYFQIGSQSDVHSAREDAILAGELFMTLMEVTA